MISTEMLCKCKKQKCWIEEGKKTDPCPSCGRVYIGKYSRKKLNIVGKEVK